MTGTRVPAFLAALLFSLTLAIPWSTLVAASGGAGGDAGRGAGGAGDSAVLLFAAPGMRPDLVEAFAAEGALPAIADMLETGAAAGWRAARPLPGDDRDQPADAADRYVARRARHRRRPLLPHRFARLRGLSRTGTTPD